MNICLSKDAGLAKLSDLIVIECFTNKYGKSNIQIIDSVSSVWISSMEQAADADWSDLDPAEQVKLAYEQMAEADGGMRGLVVIAGSVDHALATVSLVVDDEDRMSWPTRLIMTYAYPNGLHDGRIMHIGTDNNPCEDFLAAVMDDLGEWSDAHDARALCETLHDVTGGMGIDMTLLEGMTRDMYDEYDVADMADEMRCEAW